MMHSISNAINQIVCNTQRGLQKYWVVFTSRAPPVRATRKPKSVPALQQHSFSQLEDRSRRRSLSVSEIIAAPLSSPLLAPPTPPLPAMTFSTPSSLTARFVLTKYAASKARSSLARICSILKATLVGGDDAAEPRQSSSQHHGEASPVCCSFGCDVDKRNNVKDVRKPGTN